MANENTSAMRKTVTILEVEERKAQKSGNPYWVCQCVVHGEKKRVGELMVFNKDIELTEGEFFADFEIDVNFERKVGATLVKLTPTVVPRTAPAPTASAAPKVV